MVEQVNSNRPLGGAASVAESELGWDPATYEAISRHFQVRNAREVLDLYPFRGNECVLDIGSGDGLVTATILAPRVREGRVIGVDSSDTMLARAWDKYKSSEFPNVSFLKGDACDLDAVFEENLELPRQVDLIFSNAVLHWLIDNQTQSDTKHLAALHGMNQRLSPDGQVLLAFVGQGALQDLVNASLEVTKLPQWSRYFEGFRFPELYSASHYAKLMAQAGLKSINVEIIDRTMRLSSADELVRWYQVSMRSFMACLGKLDLPSQLDFASQAVQRYVGPHCGKGEVSVIYRDLVARATKGP